MKNWSYPLFVFFGGCSYGILSTFVKLAYSKGFSVEQVVGSQVVIGCLLIWLLVLMTKRNKITFKQFAKLVASGIPMGLTGIFYYLSLQTLNASLAIIFLFQFIWIGSILEWVIDKRKPTTKKVVSIAILMIGSVLASGLITQTTEISSVGAIWGALAAFTFALFIYLSGRVENNVPAVQKSAIMALGSFFVLLVIFPPTFIFDPEIVTDVFIYGVILGLFGVALPPLLFSIGMPYVGAGLGTILSASELPVAIIMSSVVLGEIVKSTQWFGVILILLGIIYGNVEKQKLRVKE